MVGPDRVVDRANRRRPMHDHGIGADTLDAGAQRDQEVREILHMRLGRRITHVRGAVGDDRGHQRIFGRSDTGLVEKDIRTLQARAAQLKPGGCGDGSAELFEGQEMRIEPATADDVATGRRQYHLAATRQQGAREQDRSTDPRAKFRVEVGGTNILGVNDKGVGLSPFGGRADRADQFHQRFGIANPRDVIERDGVFGQKRRGDNRQRRILVAGRLDGAGEPVAALNDVLDRRCGHFVPHTPTFALSELSWMNSRRGSTTSPISLVKMSSASSTSLILTCKSERSLVSRVVSQS